MNDLDAVLHQVFAIAGRGTVFGIEIRRGTVSAGDAVVVPVAGGGRSVAVRSVDYVDRCRPPLPPALVGLIVDGIRPDEVAIGGTIRGTLRP